MNINIVVDDVRTVSSAKSGKDSYTLVLKVYTDEQPSRLLSSFQLNSATLPTPTAGQTIASAAVPGVTPVTPQAVNA